MKIIQSILCFFGFHKWTPWEEPRQSCINQWVPCDYMERWKERRCERCGRLQQEDI